MTFKGRFPWFCSSVTSCCHRRSAWSGCEPLAEPNRKPMETFSHYGKHSTTPPTRLFNQIPVSRRRHHEHSDVFSLCDRISGNRQRGSAVWKPRPAPFISSRSLDYVKQLWELVEKPCYLRSSTRRLSKQQELLSGCRICRRAPRTRLNKQAGDVHGTRAGQLSSSSVADVPLRAFMIQLLCMVPNTAT